MKLAMVLFILIGSSQMGGVQERRFEFTYVVDVDIPEGAKDIRMWLPYPKRDDHQDIRLLAIESPVPTTVYQEYEYRNSMLFLSVPANEFTHISVEMKFRVTRKEHKESDFIELEDPEGYVDSSAARWLGPDRLIPFDERVSRRAVQITEGHQTVVDKAKSIYDYVVNNFSYDEVGKGLGRGDINFVMDSKTGNCADFHAVFIGLNRAVGIPAKFKMGFLIPVEEGGDAGEEAREGEREVDGYHCWAEFYVTGYGWVPVDVLEGKRNPDRQEYFFGAHDENRVEFTVGRDIKLNPQQSASPLNFFIYPHVEIDGERLGNVQQRFFFKNFD